MTKISRLFLVVVGFILLTAVSSTHEYYVSVTRVEHVPTQNSVQIITQIFIDDFEALLQKRYDDNVVLAIENESEQVEVYMRRYLKDKLGFLINGNKEDFVFIGKKYEDDIVYCYLEIEDISTIESMVISNEILCDLYEEQENIVRTKINSKNKSFILNKANIEAVLNFN